MTPSNTFGPGDEATDGPTDAERETIFNKRDAGADLLRPLEAVADVLDA